MTVADDRQWAPRPPASQRGRPWDDAAIRRELSAFLVGRRTWPTVQEFIDRGGQGLREALDQHGGAAHWAREMGLAEGDRAPGGVRKWTDARIERALRGLLRGADTWPTKSQFERAGLRGLYETLRERGEDAAWAQRMGVSPPRVVLERRIPRRRERRAESLASESARQPPWPRWTEETIAADLRLFLGARADWPAHKEFVADGRKGLYHAILKHGGTRAWAARMGVQWVDHAHRRVRAWTDEGVREELARFLADRDHWPTEREFRAAGLGGLSRALQRLGGTQRWQREFSLRRPGS